jgi:GNAT superfamily N-acetyltransferase
MMENVATGLKLIAPATHPDYRKLVAPLAEACWPEFMLHDPVADKYWGQLFEYFSGYQFGLLDESSSCAAAMGQSVPLRWDGALDDLPEQGWDWALQKAVEDYEAGREPNIQCAIQVAIHPAYRGRGLSIPMVEAMRAIGKSNGFKNLIAPVRPSQKAEYPLSNIDQYVKWTDASGSPFDAWLRIHSRLGAKIMKVCHESMLISGSLDEWHAWTGLAFPETGAYYVPGALNPVEVDVKVDRAIYVEPNVWMVHPLD